MALASSHNYNPRPLYGYDAVLQEAGGAASWAQCLCEDATPSAQKSSHQALASVPTAGRLMVALHILRNGASLSAATQLACAEQLLPLVTVCFCKHVPLGGVGGGPGMGTAIVQAIVLFMAACSSNRYKH